MKKMDFFVKDSYVQELEEFELELVEGRLFVKVIVNGECYTKDVTEYFKKANAHDDWLDYKLGL